MHPAIPDNEGTPLADWLGSIRSFAKDWPRGVIDIERPVAALYVETGGSYYGIPGVDPWDEARDARQYAGPHPVVCHSPCQRWGKLWAGQPLWIKRTGERKVKGDDGGCFSAALTAVRQFGGVLEHPCDSHAWEHFGLAKPPRSGGWIKADAFGWTCCVEQGRYGHYARKPTWLYAVGCDLPELEWGRSEPVFPQWALDSYGLAKCKRAGELAFKGGGTDSAPRIGTPPAFRDLLISIARTAQPGRCRAPGPRIDSEAGRNQLSSAVSLAGVRLLHGEQN